MKIKENITHFIAENSSFIFSVPAILWQLLFLYVPLFLVIYTSFKRTVDSSWLDLTFDHYRTIISSSYFFIIARSAFIAFGVAFLCLMCAYPIAYFLALKVKRRWK